MSHSTSRRKTLAAVLAVIIVVAVASVVLIYQSRTQTQPQQKLSLNHVTFVATQPLPTASVNWPAMLAAKQGFYDKYGLTVEAVPTSGSLEAFAALATGKAQFGQLAVGVGVLARGNGTDLKYIFMTQERDPVAVFVLEKSGIKTPKDLEGKTMGISFASAEYNTMPVFAKAAGFDYKKVKYVNTSPAQYITLLMSGQIDATMTFIPNYYIYQAAATKQGQKLVTFFRYDYVDIYGTGIATTDSFIKQHPDVVKAFNEGYAYGLQYEINNPKDASVLLAGMMSGADQESILNSLRAWGEFKLPLPRQSGQPYGIMDDKTWNATNTVMVNYLGSKWVPPTDIYTNEFIPSQYVPKAQLISPILSFYNNLHALPCEKPDTANSMRFTIS